LQNQRNLQYAAGNNVGVRYAMERGAKYVALINNDVMVDSRWLRIAVLVAEERPQVGFVGFRVFNEYRDEDWDGRLFEAAITSWQGLEVTGTKHIAGCALFIRTEVFERIGSFDEAYVAYWEENDLQKRAVRVGYEMVRVNLPLWHHSMSSWSKLPWKASWLDTRNALRYAIKHEKLRGIFHQVKWVASIASNPSSKVDRTYFHYRRLRPSNFFVNSVLLLCAIAWNLIFLGQTLSIRKAEREKLKANRTRLIL
jgi:GT2 family glycosyltransferase